MQISIDLIKNGFTLKLPRNRWYSADILTDINYTDAEVLLANAHTQAECLRHSPEQVVRGIGLHVNADKTSFMCFTQKRAIFTLSWKTLKLTDQFSYRCNNISPTKREVNIRQMCELLQAGFPSDGSLISLIK